MNENRSLKYLIFKMLWWSTALAIPLAIIDAPIWVITIVSLVMFSPFAFREELLIWLVQFLYALLLRPGLYIWALVVAINGPQDIIAIAFYIIAGLQAISIVKNFLGYLLLLFSAFSK